MKETIRTFSKWYYLSLRRELTNIMAFSKLDLSGRVAVVIGGTSGIGRALAHGLAEAGADVVPSSRRSEQVDTTAAEIEALGRKTIRCTSEVPW